MSENEKEQEQRVVKYSVTLANIAELQEEYKDIPQDLSVKKNYSLVKKRQLHVKKLRTEVEARRKELKADALAWGKLVDGTANEIKGKLLEIENPLADARKAHDDKIEIEKREAALAEEKRVDKISSTIAEIIAYPAIAISMKSDDIEGVITELRLDLESVDTWAMEFSEKAKLAINESIEKITALHEMKMQQEKAAEIAAAAEAKRIKEEEEARVAREAQFEKDRLALEAERIKIAEDKRIADAAAAAAKKLQDEKDAQAAKEKAALEAKIAEMEEAQVKEQDDKPTPKREIKPGQKYSQDFKDTGNALIKAGLDKALIEKILGLVIKGEIPNLEFTGEV